MISLLIAIYLIQLMFVIMLALFGEFSNKKRFRKNLIPFYFVKEFINIIKNNFDD